MARRTLYTVAGVAGVACMAPLLAGQSYYDLGATAISLVQRNAPVNPPAGTRYLFMDQATGEVSVRTSAGTTVSLEAQGGGGGPAPLVVARKTADQASTSATFADVTGLTFSLAANTSYSIQCELSYVTAIATTALQVALNGPAGATAMRYTVTTGTTATAVHVASQSAYDANTNPATGGAALALPVRLAGTVENGATAGTLALRLRTEVAASSVTIQRGSHCVLF